MIDDERTYSEQAAWAISKLLSGLPKSASAKEIDAQLRGYHRALDVAYSYSLWRTVVRRVLAERARVAAFEGAPPDVVRAIQPRRRPPRAKAA